MSTPITAARAAPMAGRSSQLTSRAARMPAAGRPGLLRPGRPVIVPSTCTPLPRLSARRKTAATTNAASQSAQTSPDVCTPEKMEEVIEFLKEDLPHLFDEQGIDATMYDNQVEFRDPITKYDSIDGYLFNIQMLRYLFSPKFYLNNITQSGPNEVTTRWTMEMVFSVIPWQPKLTFTGLSIMGINPKNGKFVSHLDLWDSVEDNRYFSIEGLKFFVQQVLDLSKVPELEGPAYRVMYKKPEYEIRCYEAYLAAQTSTSGPVGGAGFNKLAGYIFGGNEAKEQMDMTTPVMTTPAAEGSKEGTMQFIIGGGRTKESAPEPKDSSDVQVIDIPGGFFAAISFGGVAFDGEVAENEARLRGMLVAAGLKPLPGFKLARYNDPGTLPPFRRNEVLIELEEWDMATYMSKWGPV